MAKRASTSRRTFLQIGGTLSASSAVAQAPVPASFARPDATPVTAVEAVRDGVRHWIGPAYWANRWQDWRASGGRIECLAEGPDEEVRTVALLTREIAAGDGSAHLQASCGSLSRGSGLVGFLIGAGGGKLDYRAAALVQRMAGEGGGILCVYTSGGEVQFLDHTSEDTPLQLARLDTGERFAGPPQEEVTLRLDVQSAGGTCTLRLTALAAGKPVAGAACRVPESKLLGVPMLVSSHAAGGKGARYWFRDVETGGSKLVAKADRAIGPVIGCMYSLSGRVMKLSAQLAPAGDSDPRQVEMRVRPAAASAWSRVLRAEQGSGYNAIFRADDWDSGLDWDYEVSYLGQNFAGRIRRDPGSEQPLKIAICNCLIAAARNFDSAAKGPEIPIAEPLGRFTDKNIYYPHALLASNVAKQNPDLMVFAGDQLYEGNPTRTDRGEDPTLDYLYKWSLFLLTWRDLLRSTPAVVQTDDHDVYHGNLWGNGGRQAPQRDQNRGGYRNSAAWVNMVQRTQCGHNPDPVDPAPVDRGITVYFTSFRYGGVNFALLEDRKFKTAPIQGQDLDVHEPELLGERQEKFLEDWGRNRQNNEPMICLTQTTFACVQTSPRGRPLLDWDANGHPKPKRDQAIRLLKQAGAIALAGDQHLATLVRHGVDSYQDGIWQFTAPASGSSWQRWFEPAKPLPNQRGVHTGDWEDAFGNRVHIAAVANPKLTFAEYRKYVRGRSQGLGDRKLKSEGYGMVIVDRPRRRYVLECWPWIADPASDKQFDGWPFVIPFADQNG